MIELQRAIAKALILLVKDDSRGSWKAAAVELEAALVATA